MKMKYPLIVAIVTVWFLVMISWMVYTGYEQSQVGPKFEEIGGVQFHEAQLKAWKAGDCYVFGVDFQKQKGQPHGQPPVFFSNCQR